MGAPGAGEFDLYKSFKLSTGLGEAVIEPQRGHRGVQPSRPGQRAARRSRECGLLMGRGGNTAHHSTKPDSVIVPLVEYDMMHGIHILRYVLLEDVHHWHQVKER